MAAVSAESHGQRDGSAVAVEVAVLASYLDLEPGGDGQPVGSGAGQFLIGRQIGGEVELAQVVGGIALPRVARSPSAP